MPHPALEYRAPTALPSKYAAYLQAYIYLCDSIKKCVYQTRYVSMKAMVYAYLYLFILFSIISLSFTVYYSVGQKVEACNFSICVVFHFGCMGSKLVPEWWKELLRDSVV